MDWHTGPKNNNYKRKRKSNTGNVTMSMNVFLEKFLKQEQEQGKKKERKKNE